MKKILFFLFLLPITIFGQQLEFKKGNVFQGEQKLSHKEVKEILKANPKALEMYNAGYSKGNTGGFIMGFGLGLMLGDLALGFTSDTTYPTVGTYIGAGLTLASIPIISGYKKKMQAGVNIYNEGLNKANAQNPSISLNIISNKQGVGLGISF